MKTRVICVVFNTSKQDEGCIAGVIRYFCRSCSRWLQTNILDSKGSRWSTRDSQFQTCLKTTKFGRSWGKRFLYSAAPLITVLMWCRPPFLMYPTPNQRTMVCRNPHNKLPVNQTNLQKLTNSIAPSHNTLAIRVHLGLVYAHQLSRFGEHYARIILVARLILSRFYLFVTYFFCYRCPLEHRRHFGFSCTIPWSIRGCCRFRQGPRCCCCREPTWCDQVWGHCRGHWEAFPKLSLLLYSLHQYVYILVVEKTEFIIEQFQIVRAVGEYTMPNALVDVVDFVGGLYEFPQVLSH